MREHRPKTVSLVPTALRMVLDADVDDDVLREHPLGRVGHRAARPRPGRGVHRALRRARAHVVRRHRVRRRRRRLEPRRPRAVRARPSAGSVGRAHAGLLAARRRPRRRHRPRARRRRPARGARRAAGHRRLGAHHRPRASRRRRLPLDRRAVPTRPSCAAGYKVQPEVVRAALERVPGVAEARGGGRRPTSASARSRSPRSNDDRAPSSTKPPSSSSRARTSPDTRSRCRSTVVDALPRTASGKADLAAVRELVAESAAARR